MAIIKYEIINESRGKNYGSIFEKTAGDAWRDSHIQRNTWGNVGEYVITETDITLDIEEASAKEEQKKIKKENALIDLSEVLSLDFNKKEDIELAIKRIVHYLEIEINGDTPE